MWIDRKRVSFVVYCFGLSFTNPNFYVKFRVFEKVISVFATNKSLLHSFYFMVYATIPRKTDSRVGALGTHHFFGTLWNMKLKKTITEVQFVALTL